MDINLRSVNKKIVILGFAAGMVFTGCRSLEPPVDAPSVDGEDSIYFSRPKVIVDSPVASVPYALKWEGNSAAKSYEIQSAVDLQFTEKRLSWTTRNESFLLEAVPEGESFIRIRSHFNGESSRWSEVLKIERTGGDLKLERLRS